MSPCKNIIKLRSVRGERSHDTGLQLPVLLLPQSSLLLGEDCSVAINHQVLLTFPNLLLWEPGELNVNVRDGNEDQDQILNFISWKHICPPFICLYTELTVNFYLL